MKVEFRTNLGSRDAQAIGLDYKKCLDGKRVDVSEEQAELLSERGWVKPISAPKVKAVAKKPAISNQTTETSQESE